MKCPECVEAGLKSKVFSGGGVSTNMGSFAFWDEEGEYHNHDMNLTTYSYTCSNGHAWYERQIKKCPNCKWSQ